MNTYTFHMPTKVYFGVGMLEVLGTEVAPYGAKPFVVTGKHSARATGTLDRVLAQLPGAVAWEGVEENPTMANCAAGAEACRAAGCDVIVAVGGGSAMDAAKAIAVLVRNEGNCGDYFGSELYAHAPLPVIAVPTTAGTGSEVTPYAVVVDEVKNSKQTIKGEALFPKVAVLDPALTVTMPEAVTVATGLDALSQAMEGMLSKKATAFGDGLALEACRLVWDALPKAVSEPEDLEARGAMLQAAMLSGCIIAQSGTTLVHGMGYYYTLQNGIAHGLANGLLLAPIFRVNALHQPEKVAALAEALGVPTLADEKTAGQAITQALHMLFAAAGCSPTAKDAGVKAEELQGFAEDIIQDPYRFKNQWGTFTVDEVLALYRASYDGV